MSNQSYGQWYALNFGRTNIIVANVEKNLQDAFKDKNEGRILDIWIDLPAQIVNQFIDNHFVKMNKEMQKIDNAAKKTEMLAQSIHFMEQIKKLTLNTSKEYNKKKFDESLAMANFSNNVAPKMHAVRIANDKADHQQVIEKRLIGQLGERFKHA